MAARLTKQERELLAQLSDRAKAEETEDESYEVWVKNEAGHQVKLTGAKARRFMAKFGIDDDDAEEEEVVETEETDEHETDEQPKGGTGYFRGRRA